MAGKMNKIVFGLCLTLYPAIATAGNFDACVNDAKQTDSVTTADGYVSYRCENATAEKLSARPDECPAGNVKPPLRSLVRTQTQLDDGLLTSLSWRAGRCSGSCEMRSFDSREATYNCEVRIYNGDESPAETPRNQPPAAGDRQATPQPRRLRSFPPRYSRLAAGRYPDRPHPVRPPFYADRPDYPIRPSLYGDRPDYPRRPPLYAERPDYPRRPPPYAERPIYPDRPPPYAERPDYPRWPPFYAERPDYPGRPPLYADRPDYPYRPADYPVLGDYPDRPPVYSDRSDYPDYPDRPPVYPDPR
jgi:hypothetical protein